MDARPAGPVRINCHIPITVRIVGVPSDDELAALGRALTRAVAARLAEAERLLAHRHPPPARAPVEAAPALVRAAPSGGPVRLTPAPAVDPAPAVLARLTVRAGGPGPSGPGPSGSATVPGGGGLARIDEGLLRREEQRAAAVAHGGVAGAGGPADEPDPFEKSRRDLLDAVRATTPDEPPVTVVPGDPIQQRRVIAWVDPSDLWPLTRVQDAMRRMARFMDQWERAQKGPGVAITYDEAYWMDRWRTEFTNSVRYILYFRGTRRYNGQAIPLRTFRRWQLRDAEAKLPTSPPPLRSAQETAFWAAGLVVRTEQLRLEAAARWQADIDLAVDQFLRLNENHVAFMTERQNATPVVIYGLPEYLEGTVPATIRPDLLQQDSPGFSPSVVTFMDALQKEYGRKVIAENYPAHERSSMYVGDVASVGKYSFDIHLDSFAKVDANGFYDHDETVRFFRAADRAAKSTKMAWIAYYNDFGVAKQVNEELGVLRVGFSGAGTPRNAGPELEGSIHHGPAPYILHVHMNIMPTLLAAQLFGSQQLPSLPHVDLGGTP